MDEEETASPGHERRGDVDEESPQLIYRVEDERVGGQSHRPRQRPIGDREESTEKCSIRGEAVAHVEEGEDADGDEELVHDPAEVEPVEEGLGPEAADGEEGREDGCRERRGCLWSGRMGRERICGEFKWKSRDKDRDEREGARGRRVL